ncbi:unnamed protein product [Dovyalis caffra]|uniref:Uncharacterized protein n=1 Tax=Dovyalis caffra TaxID=77055 RepID=A0AAV1QSY5_9ROSI|nr:unnamed protein product [Dovyalis caffra]
MVKNLRSQAAGPFYALLGFLIFPFLWSIPEALITAELSTAYSAMKVLLYGLKGLLVLSLDPRWAGEVDSPQNVSYGFTCGCDLHLLVFLVSGLMIVGAIGFFFFVKFCKSKELSKFISGKTIEDRCKREGYCVVELVMNEFDMECCGLEVLNEQHVAWHWKIHIRS